LIDLKYCQRCATPLAMQEKFGALRPTCPTCGFIVFMDPKVVAAVLVEHKGKILLGRRNIDPGRGKWSFPSGYVNRGEKVELAALREVKEETNLDINLTALLGVFSDINNPIILIVYCAEITCDIKQMSPQQEEVSELGFYNLENLPELAFPFDQTIMQRWASRNRQIILDY
jgi:ADP-ribose pyrophosphatase YjhB (NUDIX family)